MSLFPTMQFRALKKSETVETLQHLMLNIKARLLQTYPAHEVIGLGRRMEK
jgi:hypothetical protein